MIFLFSSAKQLTFRHTTPAHVYLFLIISLLSNQNLWAADESDQFEIQIRPLLVERCHKCHAGNAVKGGLRLDSRQALLQGGDTGPAVIVGKPEDSLLMQAVRHQNGLAMPPDGKLSDTQVMALATWIKKGAIWPGDRVAEVESNQSPMTVAFKAPNVPDLAGSLQLWLRADSLHLDDGQSVPVWPDQSGHGRDVAPTQGIRDGGVGLPGSFIQRSAVMGRPAVRFTPTTGMASSPGNPVEIRGDAALTIMLVINLGLLDSQTPYANVLCIGNPAAPGDPGRPLAAMVEIDAKQGNSLDLAGGWGHDTTPANGSFQPLFSKSVLMTIIKRPGALRTTTQFYVNGELLGPREDQPLNGRDEVPDIQHRGDVGIFLGKALGFCGGIQGDLSELIVYNTALNDTDRQGVESHLCEKYGLWIDSRKQVVVPAVYTDAEKNHWAYQPVRDFTPPDVKNETWIKTPVDRFTLAILESQSLSPAPATEKLTWLRRVTFDLTGLPPTPAEVDAYLSDASSSAEKAVVERLLQSPQYGECWGRHWLDVVRYAETTANDANAVMRYAWRYRNYVIDAFNRDLPYDQFLIEQLAGDLLPATDSLAINTRRIIATGYLMVGPKALAETDKEQSRLDIVDDQIDVTGRAILGLTLACARCHDHKFDAIRMTDYYALAGIFRSTEPFQDEARNATMWWEQAISQGDGVEPVFVMAPKDSQPRNMRVHLRGNRFTLGKIVPRGALGIVGDFRTPSEHDAGPLVEPHQVSSGRLELARWIASRSNPLTARVMVNRVWQHHFGKAIVATSDNFGTRGERPAHPELLDWLASRFVENGWSIKQLHRLIVLSNSYRMQNAETGLQAVNDPAVRGMPAALQFHRRRLSAEELRDAMLAVSGRLDQTPGSSESGEYLNEKAEGIGAKIRPNRVAADDEFYTRFTKRSVYLPIVRNMLPDVLALFDAADPNSVTAVRNETTVASQSLFLLNHPFVREQARAFAQRLLADTTLTDEQRIIEAHRLAFGRAATPDEISDARELISQYLLTSPATETPETDRRVAAWQAFCQTLLCANEFMYLE